MVVLVFVMIPDFTVMRHVMLPGCCEHSGIIVAGHAGL